MTLALIGNDIDREIDYYLSGPMAGYPENNFPAFEQAEQELRREGLKVTSPHKIVHTGLSGKPEEWGRYLQRDIEVMLNSCGGIIMLNGWTGSKGARLELFTAMSIDWPVYYYHKPFLVNMNKEITS